MSPTSVKVFTVMSKIYMEVLPCKSGLAFKYLSGTMLLSNISCSEYVSRMQFILNLNLISIAMSFKVLHSSPSTQCLHICPPDQLPPASFTLLPVASTIFISSVDKGNLMSSTWNKAYSLEKLDMSFSVCNIKPLSIVLSGAFPIVIN